MAMSRKEICALARSKKKKNGHQYTKAKEEGREVIISQETRNKISSASKKRRHSDETKQLISEKGRKSEHRRLRRKMIEYKGVLLDSTWELNLAKVLDKKGIRWTRPTPLKYIDKEGKVRNYFPDFFLPDYDLYLDPKNPHAYNVQKDKIEVLTQQYTNIIFLLTEDEIEKFAPIV